MATAKQIAWRKKFAALSKAGKLPTAKKRKPASKLRDSQVEGMEYYLAMAKEAAEKRGGKKTRSKNPVTAQSPTLKRKPAVFKIQVETSRGWKTISEASDFDKAKTFAQTIHALAPTKRLRVDG